MRIPRLCFGLVAVALALFVPMITHAQVDAGAVATALEPPLASPVALPHWLGEVWFWVVLLTPSIVTGLTRYRQLGGLSVFLDLLSFVTHRNSPGTFQLPLAQVSKAPTVLVLLVALGLSACATVQLAKGHYEVIPPDQVACSAALIRAAAAQASCDRSPPPPTEEIVKCAAAAALEMQPCAPIFKWVPDVVVAQGQ